MPEIFSAPKTKPVEKVAKQVIITKIASGSRFLKSFISRPLDIRFENQEAEEKIILLLRQHPIVNVPWILLVIILIFAPGVLKIVLPADILPINFQIVTVIIWYLFVFAYAFEKFVLWYYNVYIVTDERVIDVDFPSLLYRDITEAMLDRIEEINNRKGGYLRSLFDFGDVLVQTAGAIPEIRFEDVPDPEKVTHIIYDLVQAEENEDKGIKQP